LDALLVGSPDVDMTPHPLQTSGPEIVLASGSATRRHLLTQAGLRFTARAVAVDEVALRDAAQAEGASGEEAALMLAEAKAMRVRDPDAVVIGADQILVEGERWLSKPDDLAAARAQLWSLRGKTHSLATAVAVRRGGVTIWTHVESPLLTMRRFSEGFLDAYLEAEGHQILSSVGCYRLEGMGVHLFDRVEGSFASVLGLPLMPLLGFLRQHGVLLP